MQLLRYGASAKQHSVQPHADLLGLSSSAHEVHIVAAEH